MIVSAITSTSRTVAGDESVAWRSLARRGMLHSECESFDYVRLAPGTVFALRGQDGTEGAWFAVAGSGLLAEANVAKRGLAAGDLVLVGAGQRVALIAGDAGMELLWLEVLPRAVVQALPVRRPVV